jgi:curved DNA-binding protein CbpA
LGYAGYAARSQVAHCNDGYLQEGRPIEMGWYIYFGIVLVASLVLGWHLGRFRAACTEMTGMMAGMTIGMLGGFALGYGMAAAAGRDLFVGNLVGVVLGALLGGWFGRAGDLMGIMDGAMGGVMGGSMGAMIAAMIYPDWKLQWTGVLFGGVYVVGALALTALIESRTPDHGHLHWLLPKLTLVRSTRRVRISGSRSGRATDAAATAAARPKVAQAAPASTKGGHPTPSTAPVRENLPVARPIRDYYAMLKVEQSASLEAIEEAYLDLLATADQETVEHADRALITLRDPERRARYDAALEESRKRQSPTAPEPTTAPTAASSPVSSERGDCCPPPKKKVAAEPAQVAAAGRPAVRPVGVLTPSPISTATPSASALVAASTPSKPAELPAKKPAATGAATQAAPARQAGQLPSLKSANAAHAASQANSRQGNGQANSHGAAGSHGNGHSNPGKQQRSKQIGQHAAQQGAHRSAHQGPDRSAGSNGERRERDRRQARGRLYVEPANTGRRVMIGAAMGAAAMLLVFWIAFSATGGVSGAGGAQSGQGSYSNPANAVYHAPGAVPSEAQLEGEAVVATVGADGVQTANLVLDEGTSSYSPAAIKVKKGMPVRLNLSNTNGGRDCRSVVDITALGARGFIDSGQPSTLDFTPSQAGVYEINCPMRMVNPSYIVVTNQ